MEFGVYHKASWRVQAIAHPALQPMKDIMDGAIAAVDSKELMNVSISR